MGGRRREVRGLREGDVRVDVWIWRMGVMSRVVRIWEEMWDSSEGVRGTEELEESREMDIFSRLSRSAWTVWSCTRVEEADEPERMVWRIEKIGSMSQFVTNPRRVLIVVVRRWYK